MLIHELCHALGADYASFGQKTCEVIADSASFIACASVGLDASGDTVGYVTDWLDGENPTEAVMRVTGVIDALAVRIEAVLDASHVTTDTPDVRKNDSLDRGIWIVCSAGEC